MLGLLINGIMHCAAAIDKRIKDKDLMSSPMYYQNGLPVYMDSSRNKYINGEKVVTEYDYQNKKLIEVGEKSRTVYFDPELETKKRMDGQSEKYKQEAIKNGELAYMRYNYVRKKYLTCEISTDKFITELEGRRDGSYWKYYLTDKSEFYGSKSDGDEGIEITQEEYDGLNIHGGTHRATDLYRYTCVFRKGKVYWQRREGV